MPGTEPLSSASIVVTGSSGFIGTHLSAALSADEYSSTTIHGIDLREPVAPKRLLHHTADICSRTALENLRPQVGDAATLIHLAAAAEVLIPWPDVGELISTNIDGTYAVLDTLAPGRVVFASSSSVYGDAGVEQTTAGAARPDPQCLYAMSKMNGEMLIREWARETGLSALNLRFGNVVGVGCRGLIPYLVAHATRYPRAERPARLRGRGALVRDYVPVGYIARVLTAAARMPLEPSSAVALNVGTGRGTTNREIAEFVCSLLAAEGLRLEVIYDDEPGWGESRIVVLDMAGTVELTGLEPPAPEEVRASIRESVHAHLKAACVS
jgi:nucleoside-diphosphate-sugar epimerase